MYGQGNLPPPYRHPSQLPPPNQMGSTGPQGSPNPPYPAPTSHSYPIPHATQQYAVPFLQQIPPPPPRLPFPPHQPFYQSTATPPPNFVPAPPLPRFGPLGTNPTATIPIPTLPPPTVPPPPPSLPPPPMPPPPPDIAPKPSSEEVVRDIERLDSASGTNLEREKSGSVSPALSDMDMEGI